MRRVAGVVVLGLLVAGCGGGSREGESVATSMPAPSSAVEQVVTSLTSSTRVPSEEEAVLAAVQGYWNAVLAANNPPDPDLPGLRAVMAGPALATTLQRIEERRSMGQVVRLPDQSRFRSDARIERVDGDRAVVLNCLVDDSLVVDGPSGLVLNSRVSTFLFRLTMNRTDGGWRVTEVAQVKRWDGVTACDW
jgi:hypothetical protein